MKPKTTFTEFNQPPDLGRLLNFDREECKKSNGRATASEKPNIPMIGRKTEPRAASTKTVPANRSCT